MPVEQALSAMGLPLPAAPTPLASYVPAVRTGNLVFTSGQLPFKEGVLSSIGHVGADVEPSQAQNAARLAALNALAAIKTVVPNLDSIVRVVRVTGYVNSAEDFTGQPTVLNGASDLIQELFGEAGRHSRAAVGVTQLPLGACVEIDMIVEVRD